MARSVRVEFPGAFYHLMANNNTRTLAYGYDVVSNRTWVERDGPTGDAFAYDLNDQLIAGKLNIQSPDVSGAAGSQTISYDANGNRVAFGAYGSTDTYTTNNLNQYTQRNLSTATYDATGNLKIGLDASSYTYDAQNRLLSATKGGTTETFTYDGLNRQVSRTINHAITYNVYDGWELIGEYAAGATVPTNAYVSGAGGMVKNLVTNNYYYQDASGSTSHLADSAGHLLEWYRYDLQGTPIFYNSSNTQIPSSAYGVRHLFTGQQWYSELGLYDLRNRYYSPDIGRFLQADPTGFVGDATNLYRYCGNDPVNRKDTNGLQYLAVPDPLQVPPETSPESMHDPSDGEGGDPDTGTLVGRNLGWTAKVIRSWFGGPSPLLSPPSYPFDDPNQQYYSQGPTDNTETNGTIPNEWGTPPVDFTPNPMFQVGFLGGSNLGGDSLGFVSLWGATFNTDGNWWGSDGTTSYPPETGFDVLPGGQISAPGGGTVAGYTHGVGPLTPSQYAWFLYPPGIHKESYRDYLAGFAPGHYSGSGIGGSGGLTGVRQR
jgi:RHS repeat-associated protein